MRDQSGEVPDALYCHIEDVGLVRAEVVVCVSSGYECLGCFSLEVLHILVQKMRFNTG